MNWESVLRDAMTAHGIDTDAQLIGNGRLHRFHVHGDKSGSVNGWYIAHADEMPAGAFGCWKRGVSENWCAKPERELSAAERQQYKEKVEQSRLQHEAEREKRQIEARSDAERIWSESLPVVKHAYLSNKGVQAHAIRASEGKLIIPVRDASGQLCSLQFISEDGGKWFLSGGKVTGHYFSFGEPKGRILIAEGYATAASLHEATGDAVAVAFNAGNLKAVALALSEKLPDVELVLCCDNDKAGTEKGKAAAEVIFSKYCIPKFDGGTDFNDLHQQQGLEAVSAVVKKAGVSLTQRAKQVALLPPLEADEAIASITANFPVSKEAFRKEVKIYVKQQQEIDECPFPEETPWPDRVDGLRLADELEAHYTRHVIIPQGAAAVLAVWTLHTYAIDAFQHTPYILVTSPVRECGKSTLMDALEAATNKAFLTVSITAAVAFRLCEQFQPTLLLDEADNSLPKEKTELLGLLNAGHRRGARASRCEGDENKLRFFKVFGPKVIAGIGKQKDTLESRSIIIHMVRKLAGEKVARIKPKDCETLRQQCRRWADDHTQAISEIDVQLPDEMGNREADKWEPLFAIADVIGGAWPNKMRAAVGSLKPVVDDSEAISVQLLHDVWGNFGEDSERMFTDEILEALHRMEERPWRQWYKGSAISSSQLSKRLGAFGITSRQIRHSGDNRRGYRKQDLADAVLHYPLAQGVTTLQVNGDGASSGFEGVTPNPFVTPPNALKPLPDNGCNTVTPAQGGKPEDEDNPPPPTVRETF